MLLDLQSDISWSLKHRPTLRTVAFSFILSFILTLSLTKLSRWIIDSIFSLTSISTENMHTRMPKCLISTHIERYKRAAELDDKLIVPHLTRSWTYKSSDTRIQACFVQRWFSSPYAWQWSQLPQPALWSTRQQPLSEFPFLCDTWLENRLIAYYFSSSYVPPPLPPPFN